MAIAVSVDAITLVCLFLFFDTEVKVMPAGSTSSSVVASATVV
jgi:hypothetical protein